MPPCPHLMDFTGTFTCTFFRALGGATVTCATAPASSSTAASSVVALQLQPWRLEVPSIHSLLSGDTATRAVSWAPAAAAASVISATPANDVFLILPPLESRWASRAGRRAVVHRTGVKIGLWA